MSDIDNTDYDDPDDPQSDSPGAKDLREAAERGKAAVKEADAAKRELAFLKAGVDTDSPQGSMFAKAYDGELTKDAIKTAFESIFPTAPPADDGTTTPVEDRDTAMAREALERETKERHDLSAVGSQHTPPPPADPRKAAREQFNEDVADGMRREDAAAGVLAAAIQASQEGVDGAIVR